MKKRFLEYLLESNDEDKEVEKQEEIDEAHFENNEFKKHEYQYLLGVLNDIVRNKQIKLGDKVIEKTIKIDNEVAD